MSPLVLLGIFLSVLDVFAATEVCTHSLIPGAKGDQGEAGEEGEEGKLGKYGPPGLSGEPGVPGPKGEVGPIGKMGPTGDKGDKGLDGLDGSTGMKGKTGATCDCGRYRKVLGQLDDTLVKLRKSVKFVKSVLLGLMETEEKYYFLVKEAKRFREASVVCKLRGGILAMPKSNSINRLLLDSVSQAGLDRVYVGVQALSQARDEPKRFEFADSSPLLEFDAWSREEKLSPSLSATTNSSCVALLSSGTWGHAECEASLSFICEFPK